MNGKNNAKYGVKQFWLPLFLFAAAVIVFYKVLDALSDVVTGVGTVLSILTPFIIALIFSLILYKPVDNLEKFFQKRKKPFFQKHALGLGVLISYIAFILILAAILYLIIPKMVTSVTSLVSNIPYYYDSVLSYLKSIADAQGRVLGIDIANISKSITLESILSYFSFERLTGYLSGITKATGFAVNISMAFVVSIYMLLGRRHLIQTAGKVFGLFIPRKRMNRLYHYLARSCEIFCSYLYSQFLDGMVVAVLCFIIFSVARIPYALLLAIVMGICNLIPYFGAIIGGFTVVAVTLISTGNIIHSVIALACVVGVQQLDANVLQPRIVSQSVGLRPIYVLFAITVGNGLFGFVGILLGVPAFAVLRMLVVDYISSLDGEPTPLVKKQLNDAEQAAIMATDGAEQPKSPE